MPPRRMASLELELRLCLGHCIVPTLSDRHRVVTVQQLLACYVVEQVAEDFLLGNQHWGKTLPYLRLVGFPQRIRGQLCGEDGPERRRTRHSTEPRCPEGVAQENELASRQKCLLASSTGHALLQRRSLWRLPSAVVAPCRYRTCGSTRKHPAAVLNPHCSELNGLPQGSDCRESALIEALLASNR